MKSSRALGLPVVLALTTLAGAALATAGGISGKSGKQGSICTSCHQGGPEPTVTLDGPTALDAGATARYTFTVTTTNLGTGLNAAVSDGQLAPDDGGLTRIEQYQDDNDNITDEITHNSPTRVPDGGPDGGSVVYSFMLTAPEFGGPITLYAAGNAVNLNDDTDGDNASRTTLSISVNGPPKPEAGPPPASTSTGPVITPFPDAGSPPPATSSTPRNNAAPASDSGCAMGSGDSSSSSLPAGGLFAGLVGLAALFRARRSRARASSQALK